MRSRALLAQALRMLSREWRSGELRVLVLSVAVSVASVCGVGLLSDRMARGLEIGASDLLGADLVLVSRRPIAERLRAAARSRGIGTATTTTFRSVVLAGERMQLVALKAVSDGYPLRGRVQLASAPFATPQPANGAPEIGTVWADPRLLALLGVSMGDEIDVGETQLRITQVISYEPDRGGDFFSIAPRLMVNEADLERTGLIQPGSRVTYRLLLAGAENAIAALRGTLELSDDDGVTVQGVRDARPEIRNALERGGRFLALAALVSVLMCGVAIAMSARQYAQRQLDGAALLRCLGASRAQVMGLHLTKLSALALVASAMGVLGGWGAQWLLAEIAHGLLLTRLPAPSLTPVLNAVSIGFVALLGFALPPLLTLGRVPPARVLRRELGDVAMRRGVVFTLAGVCVAGLVFWQARDAVLATQVMLGGAVAVAALLAVAAIAVRLVARARDRVGLTWRFGITNLVRRQGASIVQVAAFGLGLTMLALLSVVRDDLLDAWQSSLPPDAPNYFLVNVTPADIDGIKRMLSTSGGANPTFYPMIRARLTHRNARELSIDDFTDPRARNRLTRGFNLSFSESIRDDNRIVEGQAWTADRAAPGQVSVERGVADALGLTLGDALVFDVAGQAVEARLTSIREVDWDSFRVNFFVIASPGTLENFAATYVTSFHLPSDRSQLLVELVRSFPTVTVVDVDALISKVRVIMQRASRGMEFVFFFTLLAGITVLYAAVDATLDERRYESAMLRTLGAERGVIVKGLVAEFAVLGALAGLLAAVAASALGAVVARSILDVAYTPHPLTWLIGAGVGALGVILAGVLGTLPVLRQPPLTTLRERG